jgi:hypothetical protein
LRPSPPSFPDQQRRSIPYDPETIMPNREIVLVLLGGTFRLSADAKGGTITSDLHHRSLEDFLERGADDPGDPFADQFDFGRYEGAIDALESLILAAAQAGIDVQGEPFRSALQTTLESIGNSLSSA